MKHFNFLLTWIEIFICLANIFEYLQNLKRSVVLAFDLNFQPAILGMISAEQEPTFKLPIHPGNNFPLDKSFLNAIHS